MLVYIIVKVGIEGLICLLVVLYGKDNICVNLLVLGWVMIEC